MTYKENISTINNFYHHRDKKEFNPNEDYEYIVPMFPYPSGNIHMGHIRNYSISNVVAQYYKSKGKNVFHPIGFDSFGMPAENAAIKNKVSPKEWTESNIAKMTADFQNMDFDFDWSHSIQTHKPEYYQFEQEIFRKAWEKGIIYKKEEYVNYDPVDKTVLSNEQVINGRGWRTGAQVVRKKIPMYFFDMKRYAKRLHDGLSDCNQWPKKVIDMQKNWIGYEEGEYYHYRFHNVDISIYKPSKIKDINSVMVGINNSFVEHFTNNKNYQQWVTACSTGGVSQKENYSKKIQFNTGFFIHINNQEIPVVIDMNMNEEIIFSNQEVNSTNKEKSFGKFIKKEVGEFIALKDWCISRQRYWGNPIPIISCTDCGYVINPKNVELPNNLIPTGQSNVLSQSKDFTECICPVCKKPAIRCTDTMDTFVQSSWYFHRYVSPQSNKMIDYPDTQIDHYIGGVEHATMHLIYIRFFQKMLYDFGMVSCEEPIKKLTTQGMVCKKYTKEDGTVVSSKMSKSIGNTVEPEAYIKKYGADALQMFMIFAAPPEQNFDFEDDAIVGSYRFLEEVYNYFFIENKAVKNINQADCISIITKAEQFIDKEFEGRFNLNTTVPQIMIAFKHLKRTKFEEPMIEAQMREKFVNILSIIAPQIGYFIKEKALKAEINNTSKMKM